MITAQKLRQLAPLSHGAGDRFVDALNAELPTAGINTNKRIAAFLAQFAHETTSFVDTKERWGPTPAQQRYGQRADLGNTNPKAIAYAKAAGIRVGRFYAGYGGFQLTGFDNILHYSLREFGDDRLARNPSWLATPEGAVKSSVWFWNRHALNALADAGNFSEITHKVNGGHIGEDSRNAFYAAGLKIDWEK